MNPKILLAVALTFALTVSPIALAVGPSGPKDAPPMLTIDHLSKNGGPTYYVDWDGTIFRESNLLGGLQRTPTLDDHGSLIDADSTDLVP